jgi:hypothetical protein
MYEDVYMTVTSFRVSIEQNTIRIQVRMVAQNGAKQQSYKCYMPIVYPYRSKIHTILVNILPFLSQKVWNLQYKQQLRSMSNHEQKVSGTAPLSA